MFLIVCHCLSAVAHNVGACSVAGIGGLGNEAKRNAKTDQLRPVPRHNVNKENESNEDTEPRHCRNILLCTVPQSTVTKQHGCQSFGCGLKSRGFGIGAAIRSTNLHVSQCPVRTLNVLVDLRQCPLRVSCLAGVNNVLQFFTKLS